MRKFMIALMVIVFVSLASAQSASMSNINPASKSVTVGQSFSVQVSYSTNNVNSCTLGFVDSSLPDNWESSGQESISETGGSTSTTSSPKITTASPATETDLSLELQCSSNSISPRDTSSFHVTANNPPFLEGTLETTDSIDVSSGETYTVTFSASNSGSSQTEAARTVISSPSGFSHPSSISLKEAGQDDGVIQAGKSTGTTSFDLTAEDGFTGGTLTVEFTSSEIGTTDSFQIDLNDPGGGDSGDDSSSSPGGGSPNLGGLPGQPDNETKGNASDKKLENPGTKRITAESRNGVAQVTIQKGEGVNNISVDVDPASDNAPVNKIRISSGASGEVSVSVRNIGREKPVQVPEPASEDEEDVYSYQEINTTINDSEVDAAEIDFRVNRSWLEQRNSSTGNVVMKRYTENTWETLETRNLNSTERYHNFEVASEGFSYYAVALEEQETTGNQTTDEEQAQDEGTLPIVPLVLALILIAILVTVYLYRDRILEAIGEDSSKRKRLKENIDQIRQSLHEGGLEEGDRQDVLQSVERADSLLQQGELDQAEKILSRIKDKVE